MAQTSPHSHPVGHKHGPTCGHTSVVHDNHVGYLCAGELHCTDGKGECEPHQLSLDYAECTPSHDCKGHVGEHTHGPECGHEAVPHGNHVDYLVGNHLHHPHSDHCDHHGRINFGLSFSELRNRFSKNPYQKVSTEEIELQDESDADHESGEIAPTDEELEAQALQNKLRRHLFAPFLLKKIPWHKDPDALRFVAMFVLTGGFMFVEFGVGIYANSLALISDAFHMFSDVTTLIIGFIAVQLAKRQRSQRMSYGWSRAEVVGALVNSTFLVATCLAIVIEAAQKFKGSHDTDELADNAVLVMIVAGIGLAINILGLFIFGGHNHGGHGHSHGHSHEHGHSHKHGDEHEHKHDHGHGHKDKKKQKKHQHKQKEQAVIELGSKQHISLVPPHVPDDHDHDHKHDHEHEHGDHKHEHAHNDKKKEKKEKHGHKHKHSHDEHEHKHDDGHKHDHDHKHEHDHEHEHEHGDCEEEIAVAGPKEVAHTHGGAHSHTGVSVVTPKKKKHSHGHGHGHSHGNMNIESAFLHVMGDALGSVVVLVSGALINYLDSEERFLADPLCSLVIVAIILKSCVPLLRACVHILLQGVPLEVDLGLLTEQLLKVEGVLDIHDLHVWQLSGSKIVGSVHIVTRKTDDFSRISEAVKLVLHSNGVHSSTIQPEFVHTQKQVTTCAEPVCDTGCEQNSCCAGLDGDHLRTLNVQTIPNGALPLAQ
eukprot:GILJ01002656.1.p1 GENE.GILJ01002656.1~~GILJ01002656.1.p1  ORF type:complete len:716 (-),score=73.49 GILJ01002656.1:117-2237(-)